MSIIERRESNVRSYCRSFPTVFDTAEGAHLIDRDGRRYLDFFAGAGALNYGHNPAPLRRALVEYIERGGVTHALDMTTVAKQELLRTVEDVLLTPRKLDWKVMFPGPTGTNAVESALKLARKVTGRSNVIAFTNGFHGMTLGSLAVTGNASKREGAGVPLSHVTRAPFFGYQGGGSCAACPNQSDGACCTLSFLDQLLDDGSSGIDKPAAVIVETVQAEGGVRPASMAWLRGLRELTRKHDVLLIVDDIQVGCGRTGSFFSFDEAGIEPDIVCLSKSLSGYGLPLSLLLFRKDLDAFDPGEHNGTFRGFNPAFVTARVALETYWKTPELANHVREMERIVAAELDGMAARYGGERRGRGLIQGLVFEDPTISRQASQRAFRRGLIIETAGADDEVLKLLPSLTITEEELRRGLSIVDDSLNAVLSARTRSRIQALGTNNGEVRA